VSLHPVSIFSGSLTLTWLENICYRLVPLSEPSADDTVLDTPTDEISDIDPLSHPAHGIATDWNPGEWLPR
jgi:hypothetical protein